jgi:hypothetical protein
MDCNKALKSGTIANKNSILALTIAAVMLVDDISIVTSSVIPAALANKGGERHQDLSDDSPNNDNGKNHAHDNMHDGNGVDCLSCHLIAAPPAEVETK